MADFHQKPKPSPKPFERLPGLRKVDEDDAIEAAMEKAMGADQSKDPTATTALKRLWNAELEAELEEALSGFDPSSFEVAAPKGSKGDRGSTPKDQRGQEGRPGLKTGKVIGVRGKSVFVDLGGKSEGVLTLDQFTGDLPAPGSSIEVVVERFDPDEGIQILRLKGSAIEASWENLRRDVIVEARATKVVKGGLEVDVDGIRGFMPISQIDLSRVEDASSFVNQKFKAVVTEANQREKNLVVSRKEMLERERAEMREKTWLSLEEGQTRDGIVRSIKEFGAFIDISGVDGLLPLGEMSWARVSKVEDVIRVGDAVKVKVLKIDPVARKLTLGLKQLAPSPWETAILRYTRGAMIQGKVTKLMEFGAFVELEPGIEGLIHVSELSPNRVRRVADIVKEGQDVEVRILKVEPEVKRISLSLIPAVKGAKPVVEEEDDDEPPRPPAPEPKIPLKGGLGDRDRTNR